MITTIQEFQQQAEHYVNLFNGFAIKHQLEVTTKADHICYKCDSAVSFEAIKKVFEANSDYIYQSIIAERRISYIKLKQGIETVLGTIYFLELSDQKPDGSQTNSFDHIEIYPTTITYDELVEKLKTAGEAVIEKIRPHHSTHDIDISDDFLVRLTHEPLVEKIKRDEMI